MRAGISESTRPATAKELDRPQIINNRPLAVSLPRPDEFSRLDFEAALFNPVARNWPDLRLGLAPSNRVAMRAWCHGSVGIALARLRMIELLGTHPAAPRWGSELMEAIETSIASPATSVDHLCCGNAGRAVVITLAGQTMGHVRWEEEGARIGDAMVATAGNNPENYQLLLGIDGASGLRLPGLMTGLAGLGMYLLHGPDLRWARQLLL